MLWSSNAALANNSPKYTILPKVNPANTVTLTLGSANSSTTKVAFQSNGGVTTNYVVASGLNFTINDPVTAVTAASAGVANVTITTALTAGVGFGANVSFSNTISLTTTGANVSPTVLAFTTDPAAAGVNTSYIASAPGIVNGAISVVTGTPTNHITFACTAPFSGTIPTANVITLKNTITLTTNVTVLPFTSTTGVGAAFIALDTTSNNIPAGDTVASLNSTSTTLTNAITAGGNGVLAGSSIKFSQVLNVPLFENTTPSVFKGANNQVVGVYGVTDTMVAVANTAGKKGTVPGWYVVKQGMGAANSLTVSGVSTSYSNNDLIVLSSTIAGTTNCSANIVTNGTGVVTGFKAFSNNGGFFVNTSTTTLANTTSTGSGATFGFTLGGRAGRIKKECLIALPSMNDPGTTNTALFPNHS